MTGLGLTANAQVEVKQSVTTNTNNCLGLPSVCDQTIKLNNMTITDAHGDMTLHYCIVKYHTYRIAANGTLSEVKR